MSKPFVVCHMLTSLDGKIDGDFMKAPACAPALAAFGNIRGHYACQATLYGTVTMAGSYADGWAGEMPSCDESHSKKDFIAVSDADKFIVSLDPKGALAWSANYIEKKNRPKAHVIEVLTEQASNDYIAYLRKLNVSYIFAGMEALDCSLLLEKLAKYFAIKRLMISGGGVTNWSFVQEDLIDEISIILAPVTDGNTTAVSIFEKADHLPHRAPVSFGLKKVEKLDGDVLWLRYSLNKQEAM